ncbi:hypothetical protein Tco_0644514 [Tanacetum coccineum]
MLTEEIKQSESYQMFITYSTGLLPPKKSKGNGSQGKKTGDTPETVVDVSEESDFEPARKRTSSRRVIKKKVSISADDNIIPEPDVTLELGKSMSLTEATEEEAARQVYATHERIVTESDLEPSKRRPSGIAFKDTSSVSRKLSLDPSQKLKGVLTLTPEEQLAADTMQALKESKKINKRQPNTGGSSEGTGSITGVPNKFIVVFSTSNEGTGTKPRVLDEEKVTFEAKANVTLDWGSKEESEYTEEDDDDENIKWVNTDEEEEKYDDVDDKSIDLEKTDDEETDDEFVHSEENVQDDDEETEDELVHGDDQVNDDEDEEMTNAEDANMGTDITDAEINSLLDVQIQQDIPQIQSPSVLTVPMSMIFDPSVLKPIPPQSISSISHKDLQELKEVDNATTLCALLKSKIPSAVNAYLGSSLGDALHKSMQGNIINEVKNQLPKFLPKTVSGIATLVIQSTVNKALEKTPLLVAQSSSQAQSSLKAAKSFFEYELKTIIFDTMDKSRSYLTHDKNQALFKALLNSVSLDDDITSGQANLEKILRKRDLDDEDPLAGPSQGKKTKKSRTKESEPSKKSSTSKESSKYKSPTKTSKSGKSMTAEELVEEPAFEMASDDIEQTVDDAANDADQLPNDSTQTKDKDPKKDCVNVKKLHGYVHLEKIMVRRSDRQLYKFKEGDFVDQHLNDIEDMLLLVVQYKLFQLNESDIVDFIVALRMFTRSLIIKRQVEDLQLGVESCQKKLKITKPQKTFSVIEFKELYTRHLILQE